MAIYFEKRTDWLQNLSISLLWYAEKFYVGDRSRVEELDLSEIETLFFHKISKSLRYQIFSQKLRPAYQKKLQTLIQFHIRNYLHQSSFDSERYIYDFVYNSNKTEGSRIAKDDFLAIIQNQKVNYTNKNEILEVQNSWKLREFLQHKFIRNEKYIKQSYHILTKDLLQENGWVYPRWYKKNNIIVGNAITIPPDEVNNAMRSLLLWYQSNKKILFPLQLAINFHYRFERIHPFQDGNGRIGRMLMNKILVQNDMIPLTIFAENRTWYFNAFEASSSDYMVPMYEYMIGQYEKTLEINNDTPFPL